MKVLGIVVGGGVPTVCCTLSGDSRRLRNRRFSISSSFPSSSGSKTVEEQALIAAPKVEYKPGVFDDLFLNLFRSKLVQEVGWDSTKPGYDGLIEVVNRLMMKGRTNLDTIDAAVRVLRSLFPPFLLELYKILISPIGQGKFAAMMVDYSCQFKFGVLPPQHEDDSVLNEPCLEACPNAVQRRRVAQNIDGTAFPKS